MTRRWIYLSIFPVSGPKSIPRKRARNRTRTFFVYLNVFFCEDNENISEDNRLDIEIKTVETSNDLKN